MISGTLYFLWMMVSTGVIFDRPAFNEMMEGVKNGSIKTIIVKDHSRLGRNRLIVGALLGSAVKIHMVTSWKTRS